MDKRIVRLQSALESQRYGKVARRGPRFFGTIWDVPARLATTVALLQMGNADKALETAAPGSLPRGPEYYLRAHAHALLGRVQEATTLLGQAIRAAPYLHAEAQKNPILSPLLVAHSGPPGVPVVEAGVMP